MLTAKLPGQSSQWARPAKERGAEPELELGAERERTLLGPQ